MRRFLGITTVTLIAAGAGAACATKGYVNTQVGDVNTKVETLAGGLEATQARTKENAQRIGDVDAKAGAAQSTADGAASAAKDAANRAAAAEGAAKAVDGELDALAASTRRLIYSVVLSEDQGNFKFNATTLPDAAKLRIDELVGQLKADPKGVYFEVEGHTDATGGAETNQRIGLQRAESVKRYLYEAHQIPLHKINVISFGEEKPVAPNTSTEGRAKNRRVVIRVLQ